MESTVLHSVMRKEAKAREMKQGAAPAKDRTYHALFGEEKVHPTYWSSHTKKILIGYDQDKKYRLIDVTRIPARLLKELKLTIPVEGVPIGAEIQATPETPSDIAQGSVTRVQKRSRRVSTVARKTKTGGGKE